ncbi:hypothetical protein D7D52_26430 [Nocardia yunnanensis]|uniref:Uncharacterized protein n=1 Tax=Nocardia yunnanensis TaxID=2382165 RepID=A0A386ZFU7_9NOCA|nr:hypothetical protein [Nocardia yunnanensis]AYF76762.1 hypothetical protein D7D52_26430 [Nocardia yunnanensis]
MHTILATFEGFSQQDRFAGEVESQLSRAGVCGAGCEGGYGSERGDSRGGHTYEMTDNDEPKDPPRRGSSRQELPSAEFEIAEDADGEALARRQAEVLWEITKWQASRQQQPPGT